MNRNTMQTRIYIYTHNIAHAQSSFNPAITHWLSAVMWPHARSTFLGKKGVLFETILRNKIPKNAKQKRGDVLEI